MEVNATDEKPVAELAAMPLPVCPQAEIAEQVTRMRPPSLEEAKETGSPLMLPMVDPEMAVAVLEDRQTVSPTAQTELLIPGIIETKPSHVDDPAVLSEVPFAAPFILPEVPLLVLTADNFVESPSESSESDPETAGALPEVVIHDFSEALRALTMQPAIMEAGYLGQDISSTLAEGQAGRPESGAYEGIEVIGARGVPEAVPTPPIVTAVGERLVHLDAEQETAAAMLIRQITETVSEIRQLQAIMAGPMELADLEEHLTDLSEALLETIGVEYDDESLSQFVQSLLRPECMPELTKNSDEVDLERMGTHEIKRHFPAFFTTLADLFADAPVRYLLGKFALFCESFTSGRSGA